MARSRPDPNKSLVGFLVGDVPYALPIGCVKEIINPVPLTMLPHLPGSVAGVADHRGEVIVVVDLRARFGLGPCPDQSRTKWVLLSLGGPIVGLIVDHVTDVFGTRGEEVRPSPALPGEEMRGIAGVVSHAGQLTFVLAADRFEGLAAAVPPELLENLRAVPVLQ